VLAALSGPAAARPRGTEVVMSTIIKEEDFVQSVTDGLQFISYYHPVDYIRHLTRAYDIDHGLCGPDDCDADGQVY
jgi:hypothetical protein